MDVQIKNLFVVFLMAIAGIFKQTQLLFFYIMNKQSFARRHFYRRCRTRNEKFAAAAAWFSTYRTPRDFWMRPRHRGFWKHFAETATESVWMESMRMKKATFLYIVEALEEKLQPKINLLTKRELIMPTEQVAICIYYFASCSEYRVVGDVFGVSKSTVWKIVHKVTDAILEILTPEHITLPNEEEAQLISAEFEGKSNVPQLLLVVDGSHIPISPPLVGHRDFFNRKGWASLVLQGMVDSKML